MGRGYEAHLAFAADALADVATAVVSAKGGTPGSAVTVDGSDADAVAAFSPIMFVRSAERGVLRLKASSSASAILDIEVLEAPGGDTSKALVITQVQMSATPDSDGEWYTAEFSLLGYSNIFIRVTEKASAAATIDDAYLYVQ